MPDPALIPSAAPPGPLLGAANAPPAVPHPPVAGAPPSQLGAAALPAANAGLAMKALSDVRNAVSMLENALPHIPMGSELHTEVLNTIKGISKHLQNAAPQNSGIDLMSLLQMARHAAQAQPMQTLMRAYPQNPAAPPALGGGGAIGMH